MARNLDDLDGGIKIWALAGCSTQWLNFVAWKWKEGVESSDALSDVVYNIISTTPQDEAQSEAQDEEKESWEIRYTDWASI